MQRVLHVLLFVLFVLLLFSLVGIQQFRGNFYNRCRMTKEPVDGIWEIVRRTDFCDLQNDNYQCPDGLTCGNPDEYGLPLSEENITIMKESYYGIESFDNIGSALLSTLTVITLDGWSYIMYDLQNTYNPYFAGIYFMLMVVIGAYFALNLIVAEFVSFFQETRNELASKSHYQFNESSEFPLSEKGESNSSIRPCLDGVKTSSNENISQIIKTTQKISQHIAFKIIIVFTILVGVVSQSICTSESSQKLINILNYIDTAVFCVFWVEAIIEIIEMGYNNYFKEPYKIYDTILNISGIIEICLTYSSLFDSNYIILSVSL